MIDKTIEIAMLYDFYNHLLTDKQQEIIDLYYNQDLSLGEIAETFQISRQAVYDTIKRTEKILYDYEDKLRLIQITNKNTEVCEKLLKSLDELEGRINTGASKEEIISCVGMIRNELKEMLNQ
jgi:predicted DNA-binding protein YlxM (UPF0122 family)